MVALLPHVRVRGGRGAVEKRACGDRKPRGKYAPAGWLWDGGCHGPPLVEAGHVLVPQGTDVN